MDTTIVLALFLLCIFSLYCSYYAFAYSYDVVLDLYVSMQLFITSRDSQGESIVIREPRVCTHMRQVLRMKEGDEFLVQAPLYSIPGECNSDGGGFFSSLFSSCVCNTPFDIEKLSQ